MAGAYYVEFKTPCAPEIRERLLQQLKTTLVRRSTDRICHHADANRIVVTIDHNTGGAGIAATGNGRVGIALCGSVRHGGGDADELSPPELSAEVARNDEFLARVQGEFACIAWDAQGLLRACTDAFGVYNLYYCDTPSFRMVASELKVFSLILEQRGLCLEAVAEILKYGYVISDLTLLTGVKRVPPGTHLIVSNGQFVLRRQIRSVFSRSTPGSAQLHERLHEAFSASMQRMSRHSRREPVVCSLSGGLDSRLVALELRDQGVNVSGWGCGEPGSLEMQVAQSFATGARIPMESHVLTGARFAQWFEPAMWTTEARCPIGHVHFLETLFTSGFPRGYCAHGLIGDAVMGGDLDCINDDGSDALTDYGQLRRYMSSFVHWPDGAVESIFGGEISRLFAEAPARVEAYLRNNFRGDDIYSDAVWFRYDFRVSGFTVPCLMSQVTPWADPVLPFLDSTVFEICADIDKKTIASRRFQIEFARRYYPDAFLVPRVKDGVRVQWDCGPESYEAGIARLDQLNRLRYLLTRASFGRINPRRSESYPFYDAWYRRWPAIRQFVDGVLGPGNLGTGLWGQNGVARLVRDHRNGRNAWSAIGALLAVEVFNRQFVTRTGAPSGDFL